METEGYYKGKGKLTVNRDQDKVDECMKLFSTQSIVFDAKEVMIKFVDTDGTEKIYKAIRNEDGSYTTV